MVADEKGHCICTIYFVQDSSESSQVSDEEYRQQHDREQYILGQ